MILIVILNTVILNWLIDLLIVTKLKILAK